jgi:Cft2 family RNA processing exonuclease
VVSPLPISRGGSKSARTATASKLAGKRIILDSRAAPALRRRRRAAEFRGLVADDSVDAIVLSHAHQDHVGSLPVLMRRQPHAPVFMTEATRQLSDVMLHNSVNVMLKKREEGVTSYPLFSHREVDDRRRALAARPPLHQPLRCDRRAAARR